jgi:hypothetical protein
MTDVRRNKTYHLELLAGSKRILLIAAVVIVNSGNSV